MLATSLRLQWPDLMVEKRGQAKTASTHHVDGLDRVVVRLAAGVQPRSGHVGVSNRLYLKHPVFLDRESQMVDCAEVKHKIASMYNINNRK